MPKKELRKPKFQLSPGEGQMIADKVGCTIVWVSYILHGKVRSESKKAILIQKAAHIIKTCRKDAEKKIDELIKSESI